MCIIILYFNKITNLYCTYIQGDRPPPPKKSKHRGRKELMVLDDSTHHVFNLKHEEYNSYFHDKHHYHQ